MHPFVYRLPVRFHDVDSAGIVFFARIFQYAHDAYEAWLRTIGFSLDRPAAERGYGFPLVHAEADFHKPILPGQEVVIELAPVAVGESSYTIRSRLSLPEGEALATVTTVHACVDWASRRPRPIDPALREILSSYLA